jgi:sugar phosphate permease
MGINMLIAVLGTVLFAFADSFFMIAISRFLPGIATAFGLIICLKLAALWLPDDKMGLATSLIVSIGMLGAIVAQAPMVVLIELFSWQAALLISAIFGLIIAIILWFNIIDPRNDVKTIKSISINKSLLMSIKEKQNWFCGLFIGLLNLPIAIFGAAFGSIYLMQAYNYSSVQSGSIVSMLFIGMIIGAPLFGWVSDVIRSKKIPMLFGAAVSLILIMFILYAPIYNNIISHIMFFLLGLSCSSQLLAYPIVTENNPIEISGVALGLATLIIVGGGYGLGIPVVGKILDLFGNGKIINGIFTYSLAGYQRAFIIIPIGIIISILLLFFIKEKKKV